MGTERVKSQAKPGELCWVCERKADAEIVRGRRSIAKFMAFLAWCSENGREAV